MFARLRTLLLVVGLLAGVWLRVAGVTVPGLYGDEYHGRSVAESTLGEILTTFDTVGSHVAVPALQHLAIAVLGEGMLAFRLVALVPGLLTLLLFYPIVRSVLGKEREGVDTAALVSTLLLAVNPMHVYYSRYGRAYAAIVFFGLLLVFFAARAVRAEDSRGARASWVGVLLTAAALPIFHLSSAGFVAAVAAATVFLCVRKGGARAAGPPIGVFLSAALLAFLAFLPVLGQVSDYFAQTKEVKDQPSTWFGIPLLLGGGVVEGVLLLIGLPLGLVLLARRDGAAALLLLSAVLGPLGALLLFRPHGMEYAWARYLIGSVPFFCIAIGFGVSALGRSDRSRSLVSGLAAALLFVSCLAGPLNATRPRTGQFENSYLAMRSLPGFDEPWSGASPFYDELAAMDEDLVVVEASPPITRGILLFRNHALRHGKDVRLGWPGGLPGAMGKDGEPGPYVDLLRVTADQADYVILHRDLVREVGAYWRNIYDGWEEGSGVDSGLMRRHFDTFVRTQPHLQADFLADRAARLRERLGPATYKDDQVLVWKLTE